MFSKTIRIIYLYVVSFVTLMMIVGGFISTINAIATYLWPNNYNYYYTTYDTQTYNLDKQRILNDSTLTAPQRNDQISAIDDKYATILQNDSQEKIREENERNSRLKNIFTSLAVLLVSIPLYIYHWRRIEKEKKSEV